MAEDLSEFKFSHLKTLVCGSMRLIWSDLLRISKVFPCLEKLTTPFNDITHIHVPNDHNFRHLKYLDVEGNSINEWKYVLNLSVIETLEHINLDNVGLKKVWFNESDKTTYLPCLKKLVLNNNIIDNVSKICHSFAVSIVITLYFVQWESIGELNKLASFEDLKFLRNPLLQTEDIDTCFQLIVARIKSLKVRCCKC